MLNGAIVGFGNVARHGHWPAYARSTSFRIVALVDPHLNTADHNRGLPVYASIADAAVHERLHFVDICTPPASHGASILEALGLGLHALVEKPLVLTPDEFEAVARAAAARSRTVFPVHNWRYAPALREAAAAVSRGAIGAVRSAEIEVWRTTACASAGAPVWRQNRAIAGGGIVLDHGWHALYLMLEWFGHRPHSVDAWCHAEPPIEVETDAEITLGFAGGVGVIRLTWRGARRRNRVRLDGDLGSIEIDDSVYLIQRGPRQDLTMVSSLSEGSYHPEWFPPVLTEFERALDDRHAAARFLDEAGACVHIADRVYRAAMRATTARQAQPARSG